MNKEKKNKFFKSKWFVISSLLLFVAFIVSYFVLNSFYLFPAKKRGLKYNAKDIFYLNDKINRDDPYLTKNPSLKDMIRGPIITDQDPSMGDTKARVVMVEFGDFSCRFCSQQEQILKKIMVDKKYNLRLVWKDYPARDDAAPSFKAAVAARCADEQNLFWPYHSILFDHSDNLNDDVFLEIAKQLKMDTEKFKACLKSNNPRQKIIDNIKEADALDISGVPFIYINDQEIMGQASKEDLIRIIKLQNDRNK